MNRLKTRFLFSGQMPRFPRAYHKFFSKSWRGGGETGPWEGGGGLETGPWEGKSQSPPGCGLVH